MLLLNLANDIYNRTLKHTMSINKMVFKSYAFDDARSYDIFEKYDNYRNERNLKPNRVGSDYYWLVDEDNGYFIGEISIRHRLTDDLKRYGGHIGYGVRFSEWKKRLWNFNA